MNKSLSLGQCTREVVMGHMNENVNTDMEDPLLDDEDLFDDDVKTVVLDGPVVKDDVDNMTINYDVMGMVNRSFDEDVFDDDLFDLSSDVLVPTPLVRQRAININAMKYCDSDEECYEEFLAMKAAKKAEAAKLAELVTAEMNKAAKVRKADVVDDDIEEKGSTGRRVQRWCFTYNNPTVSGDEFAEFLKNLEEVRGFVFQKEEGEQGTVHFQGYLETVKAIRTTGFQKLMKPHKMKALYAKGTKKQNHVYCTKDDTRKEGPWEYGTCEKANLGRVGAQGKRNDLDEFAEVILENKGVTPEVLEQFPGHVLRYNKHCGDLVATAARIAAEAKEKEYWREQAKRRLAGEDIQGQEQRHVELYFGPTAVGKTTEIKLKCIGIDDCSLYTKDGTNKWFCGYNGHQAVLIDEFRGDSFGTIEQFNNITNVGVQQVETKGGQAVLVADSIYIASNRHPSHWWKKADGFINWSDGRYRAVARRFAKVTWWNDAKEKVVLVNPGEDDGTSQWIEDNLMWVDFWRWYEKPCVEGEQLALDAAENYFTFFNY